MPNYVTDNGNIYSDDSDGKDSNYSNKKTILNKWDARPSIRTSFFFVKKYIFQEPMVNLFIFTLDQQLPRL